MSNPTEKAEGDIKTKYPEKKLKQRFHIKISLLEIRQDSLLA